MEVFTLTSAILILLVAALILWAAALLFRVELALTKLKRSLNPSVRRDSNGRRINERI